MGLGKESHLLNPEPSSMERGGHGKKKNSAKTIIS
jgi:hypothetical protein